MLLQEIPGQRLEEERPGIVGSGTIVAPVGKKTSVIDRIKKVPETYHDQVASKLVGWCIFAVIVVWTISFLAGDKETSNTLTPQIVDLLKTVLTTSLGYLFAAHKYGKKE